MTSTELAPGTVAMLLTEQTLLSAEHLRWQLGSSLGIERDTIESAVSREWTRRCTSYLPSLCVSAALCLDSIERRLPICLIATPIG